MRRKNSTRHESSEQRFSKNAKQDMSNASLLQEAMRSTAKSDEGKDALKKQAEEIAVPMEESGSEGAKELRAISAKGLMAEAGSTDGARRSPPRAIRRPELAQGTGKTWSAS